MTHPAIPKVDRQPFPQPGYGPTGTHLLAQLRHPLHIAGVGHGAESQCHGPHAKGHQPLARAMIESGVRAGYI